MVQICSTWFPLVDRNPQKYVENIFRAEEGDFIKATQRVYHSRQHPTRLEVGVLPPGDLGAHEAGGPRTVGPGGPRSVGTPGTTGRPRPRRRVGPGRKSLAGFPARPIT